jgi:hypothetical protein
MFLVSPFIGTMDVPSVPFIGTTTPIIFDTILPFVTAARQGNLLKTMKPLLSLTEESYSSSSTTDSPLTYKDKRQKL